MSTRIVSKAIKPHKGPKSEIINPNEVNIEEIRISIE